MSENRKQHKLPTVQARETASLPVDLSVKDNFLALIAEANDTRKGGGINLTLILYNEDGTKVQSQSGDEEVRLKWQYMPLSGPKFVAYTKAIFPEADAFLAETGFDNEDLVDRFVYVTLDVEKPKEGAEPSQYGPRLQIKFMNAVPDGDKDRIKQIALKVLGHEPKRLEPPVKSAAAPAVAKSAAPAAAKSAAPATKSATKAANPAATIPPGVDPNNPFGV